MKSCGYEYLLAKDHPRSDKEGYIKRCILVAEKALGKYLPKEHPIHHIDGDRCNDNHANLVICEDTAYHSLIHHRQSRIAMTGSVLFKKCPRCKSIKNIAEYPKYFCKKRNEFRRFYVCCICQNIARKKYS